MPGLTLLELFTSNFRVGPRSLPIVDQTGRQLTPVWPTSSLTGECVTERYISQGTSGVTDQRPDSSYEGGWEKAVSHFLVPYWFSWATQGPVDICPLRLFFFLFFWCLVWLAFISVTETGASINTFQKPTTFVKNCICNTGVSRILSHGCSPLPHQLSEVLDDRTLESFRNRSIIIALACLFWDQTSFAVKPMG